MTGSMIAVRNLRKVYRVYAHPSQMIGEVLTGRMRHREFLALDDISFDVHSGSVVGLLGRNGAGKSTLLRIIARTLDATGGTVSSRGRISAILELGTGFHGDYTGRENIYFGGICLGLGRREMHERVDEIIAFSELEDFIDQPFRTYSSGMQARLTFSVATCVDPDILIVDEALAVGDAKFQLKSFDRIREFKRRGKAILLVSHSINQITAFCDHAILLDHGRMLAQGDPNRVGNIYHELLFGPEEEAPMLNAGPISGFRPNGAQSPGSADAGVPKLRAGAVTEPENEVPATPSAESRREKLTVVPAVLTDSGKSGWSLRLAPADPKRSSVLQTRPPQTVATSLREHRYGNGAARIVATEVRDLQGRTRTTLKSLEIYEIFLTIRVYRPISELSYGIHFRDARGLDLYAGESLDLSDLRFGPQEAGTEIRAKARFRANLAAGLYFVTLSLANPDQTKYDMRFDTVELVVEATPGLQHTSLVNLEAEFELDTPRSDTDFPTDEVSPSDREPVGQRA